MECEGFLFLKWGVEGESDNRCNIGRTYRPVDMRRRRRRHGSSGPRGGSCNALNGIYVGERLGVVERNAVAVVLRHVVGTGGVVLGSGTGGEEVDSFGDWMGLVGVIDIVRIVGGRVRCV